MRSTSGAKARRGRKTSDDYLRTRHVLSYKTGGGLTYAKQEPRNEHVKRKELSALLLWIVLFNRVSRLFLSRFNYLASWILFEKTSESREMFTTRTRYIAVCRQEDRTTQNILWLEKDNNTMHDPCKLVPKFRGLVCSVHSIAPTIILWRWTKGLSIIQSATSSARSYHRGSLRSKVRPVRMCRSQPWAPQIIFKPLLNELDCAGNRLIPWCWLRHLTVVVSRAEPRKGRMLCHSSI